MLPMQNTVTTPTDKTTFEKKVHTPPSVEQDARGPKLLKGLSGKVLRSNGKSQSNTGLDSSELFNKIGSSMSAKRSTPKPLNLSQPLTPPSSVKGKRNERHQNYRPQPQAFDQNHKHSVSNSSGSIKTGALDSPVRLFSPYGPKSSKSTLVRPVNLGSSLKSASSWNSAMNHPMLWAETMEDPYLEDDSPTYLRSISKNIRNVSSSAVRRRFVSEQCSMCAEGMNSVFPGETVVQLTCSHATHYECYLAMYELHYKEGKWPQCRTCHKVSRPVDEDIINKMTSSLLTRKESTSVIEQQLMNAKLSDSIGGTMCDFTPRDQLITSADICSDGFKTPLQMSRISTNYENEDTELSFENLFGSRLLDLNGNLSSPLVGENDDGGDQQNLKIEIDLLKDGYYSVTAQIPKEKHSKHCCNKNPRRNQNILQEKRILILQVESFVKKEVDPKDEFGSLSIFDQLSYSTDGENWNHNTLVCLFEECLILFDLFEMKTIGKIPMEQVCVVNRLSETTLIIDLKSRTLPEIYFALPLHLNNHESVLEKWKYYLVQPGKELELEFMSDTAWEIFPKDMLPKLRGIVCNDKQLICNQCPKPWENGAQEMPLQLIVCLSLCHGRGETSVQCRQKIVSGLYKLLESLNDRDLLGVVTVGRNGSGESGEFGSFVGTVSKNWSGWKEYIDELETVDGTCFQTPSKELSKVWETCYRLVSTSSSLFEDEDQNQFSKQIILMTDDFTNQRQTDKNKFEEIIKNDYGFEITRASSPTSTLSGYESIPSIVAKLHNKRFKDLKVTLQGDATLKFGDMAPGEKKTLYSEKKRDSMRLVGPVSNTTRIRIPYDAEWFNLRSLAPEKVHRLAVCNNTKS